MTIEFKTATQEWKEKHVPVIEKMENWVRVLVGSVLHPMSEEHHISWVEVVNSDWEVVERKYLEVWTDPIVEFITDEDVVEAREHCNLHGYWTTGKIGLI